MVRVCYLYIVLSRVAYSIRYPYIYIYVYRYISTIYIYYIYVVYLYITLGTNNAYKNINLGRQTFNYKSVSLEILTNATITVADFIYNTEIIGKPPSASF